MATTHLNEETIKKVIRQVEFYFSDSNLPRDGFLRNTISESEDGTRMRGHLGLREITPEDVSDDTVNAVAEALKSSTTLKISEDGKKVGRTTELPKSEEVIEQLDVRTISASPIEYDIKLEDVESFFAKFAKVNSVRLPRHVADKKLFCGTALIEFSSEEDATKILTQSLVFRGAELELKPKKAFDEQHGKERRENTRRQNRDDSSQGVDYPKGLILAFKLKSTSSEDSSAENGSEVKPSDVDVKETDVKPDSMGLVTGDDDNEVSENVEKSCKESTEEESEGKVDVKSSLEDEATEDKKKSLDTPLQNDGEKSTEDQKMDAASCKDNKDVVLREDLKSVFEKFGTVKYIDFNMGENSGYIRFEEAEGSQKARAAAVLAEEGGLIVKNYVAILDPVTGEAETEYWKMLRSQDRFRGNKGNWGRGGRNNRGGRQHGGKHNRSRDNKSGNRPNKFRKI